MFSNFYKNTKNVFFLHLWFYGRNWNELAWLEMGSTESVRVR